MSPWESPRSRWSVPGFEQLAGLMACLVVAACGRVTPVDAGPADVPAGSDGNAQNCQTEGFDGSGLDARWSVLAGAVPTAYDVSGSRLLISDAPFAATPSEPATSWIYDLDTDRGNQLAWPQAIGGEDFTLTADLAWSSTLAELTLAGVGVSDAQGTIEALVGTYDPNTSGGGGAYARLHVVDGSDSGVWQPAQEPGSATFKIQRVSGTATISIDGTRVLTGTMPGLISNVVLVYVRFKNGATLHNFGSIEIRETQICRP